MNPENANSKQENSNGTGVTMDNLDNNRASLTSSLAETGSESSAMRSMEGGRNQIPEYLRIVGMDPRQYWPKKYRFTREKTPGRANPLSIKERNFYEANGYIVIDDCVSQKLLINIRLKHKELNLNAGDNSLMEKLLIKNPKLSSYVRCFCDERVMLMTNHFVDSFQSAEQATALMNNKQQQRQQLFRDWLYLPFRPLDKVVCAVIAVEPLDNVILLVPGTHRVGQCSITSPSDQESSSQTNKLELFESAPDKISTLVEKSNKGFKYINLKAGQTLFYHPGLVHGFSDDLVNFNKHQLASIAYFAAADCEYVDLRQSGELAESDLTLPINLAQFNGSDPRDYTSWLDKPKLLQDPIFNL